MTDDGLNIDGLKSTTWILLFNYMYMNHSCEPSGIEYPLPGGTPYNRIYMYAGVLTCAREIGFDTSRAQAYCQKYAKLKWTRCKRPCEQQCSQNAKGLDNLIAAGCVTKFPIYCV